MWHRDGEDSRSAVMHRAAAPQGRPPRGEAALPGRWAGAALPLAACSAWGVDLAASGLLNVTSEILGMFAKLSLV